MGRKLKAIKNLEKDELTLDEVIEILQKTYLKSNQLGKMFLKDYIHFIKVQRKLLGKIL